MHRKLLCSGFALALVLGISACEQHEWDSTKKLHQPHGGHGHGHGDADAYETGHGGDEPHGGGGKEGDDHHPKSGEGADQGGHGNEAEAKPRDLGTE